ncbi:MAG: NADPH:quinone oxidoreductase family protein [Alphaproteobacteria bacterium]|nr:NADPH:quinone oxidoreductase family protein [Alphaproteobacteria bacterium]MCB9931780.1 NADPH:quinone oxidoreductase family protein [Alphaproteobacteria bacterium]
MRAVIAHDLSGIDGLRLETVPSPVLRPGGVRIAVRAAGVSFANLLVIEGRHQNRAEPPFTPGTEVAGVVTELAPDAGGGLKLGDRVCAGLPSGGFAEEVVATDDNVFPIPDRLGFPAATLFPTIYATAFCGLVWRAALAPGETLLVHGAAGASGLAAVEIGKALGATVIATAGGEAKGAAACAHGATHVIDHRRDDVRAAVLDLTGGRGADVVFDPVGGDLFDASLRCIAPLGRLLTIGYASGRIPSIPANLLLVKNISAIGLYWGFYMAWGKTQASPALRAKVRGMFGDMFQLFEKGLLRPEVDRELPLASFAEGLRRVQDRGVIGKIVLLPDGDGASARAG